MARFWGKSLPEHGLHSLQAVGSKGFPAPGLQEALGVFQEGLTWGEEAAAQPEQLPALLQAEPGTKSRVQSATGPGH